MQNRLSSLIHSGIDSRTVNSRPYLWDERYPDESLRALLQSSSGLYAAFALANEYQLGSLSLLSRLDVPKQVFRAPSNRYSGPREIPFSELVFQPGKVIYRSQVDAWKAGLMSWDKVAPVCESDELYGLAFMTIRPRAIQCLLSMMGPYLRRVSWDPKKTDMSNVLSVMWHANEDLINLKEKPDIRYEDSVEAVLTKRAPGSMRIITNVAGLLNGDVGWSRASNIRRDVRAYELLANSKYIVMSPAPWHMTAIPVSHTLKAGASVLVRQNFTPAAKPNPEELAELRAIVENANNVLVNLLIILDLLVSMKAKFLTAFASVTGNSFANAPESRSNYPAASCPAYTYAETEINGVKYPGLYDSLRLADNTTTIDEVSAQAELPMSFESADGSPVGNAEMWVAWAQAAASYFYLPAKVGPQRSKPEVLVLGFRGDWCKAVLMAQSLAVVHNLKTEDLLASIRTMLTAYGTETILVMSSSVGKTVEWSYPGPDDIVTIGMNRGIVGSMLSPNVSRREKLRIIAEMNSRSKGDVGGGPSDPNNKERSAHGHAKQYGRPEAKKTFNNNLRYNNGLR